MVQVGNSIFMGFSLIRSAPSVGEDKCLSILIAQPIEIVEYSMHSKAMFNHSKFNSNTLNAHYK